MEEILASIRRIIADDEAGKPPKAPEPTPPIAAVAERPAPAPKPAAPMPRPVTSLPPAADMKPAPTPPSPAPADVLDLTEAMTAMPASVPAPNFRTIDGQSDIVFSDRLPEAPPSPAPVEPVVRVVEEARKQFVQSTPDRALLSNATANAVDSAFNSLAHTVLGNNARTLEDLVKEMLRPMLKSWLDDNLPGLVDRIVRAEIERVSRGRG